MDLASFFLKKIRLDLSVKAVWCIGELRGSHYRLKGERIMMLIGDICLKGEDKECGKQERKFCSILNMVVRLASHFGLLS